MRSIKFKLILSTSAMVLASLVFVFVTVLVRQSRSQKNAIADSARKMMRIVHTEVEKFLEAPENMLAAVEAYEKAHDDVDKLTLENWMNEAVKSGDTDASLLYYINEVPYSKGASPRSTSTTSLRRTGTRPPASGSSRQKPRAESLS